MYPRGLGQLPSQSPGPYGAGPEVSPLHTWVNRSQPSRSGIQVSRGRGCPVGPVHPLSPAGTPGPLGWPRDHPAWCSACCPLKSQNRGSTQQVPLRPSLATPTPGSRSGRTHPRVAPRLHPPGPSRQSSALSGRLRLSFWAPAFCGGEAGGQKVKRRLSRASSFMAWPPAGFCRASAGQKGQAPC